MNFKNSFLYPIIVLVCVSCNYKTPQEYCNSEVLDELKNTTKSLNKDYTDLRYQMLARLYNQGDEYYPYYKAYLGYDSIVLSFLNPNSDTNIFRSYDVFVKRNNSFFENNINAKKAWLTKNDRQLLTLKNDSLKFQNTPIEYKKEFVKQRVLKHSILCSQIIRYSFGKLKIYCGGNYKQFGFQLNIQQKDSLTILNINYRNQELPKYKAPITFVSLIQQSSSDFGSNKKTDISKNIISIDDKTGDGLMIKSKTLKSGLYTLNINVQTISEDYGLENTQAYYDFEIN